MKMLFLDEHIDLNIVTFNEDTKYHTLPQFGPFGSYMKYFATQIRVFRFLSDVIKDHQEKDSEKFYF